MEPPPASSAELELRITELEAAIRRYQRQASIAINLLARDPQPKTPAPLVLPVPVPDLAPEANPSFRFNLEDREFDGHRLRLTGWAHVDDASVGLEPAEIVLFFSIDSRWWAVASSPVPRPDVAGAFSLPETTPAKGFEAHFRIPRPHARPSALRLMVATEVRRDFSPEIVWG